MLRTTKLYLRPSTVIGGFLAFTSSCQCLDHDQTISNILNESQIWGYGFLAGFGISLIGFLTALLIVCCKTVASDACFEITIKTLFSLSMGALIGDSMVHILPSAY